MDETKTDDKEQLQGAFGDRGTNVNAIHYGHPYGEQLIGQAREILKESPTGTKLLKILNDGKIPVQIMKGKGPSGFSPDMMSIVIMVPAAEKAASGEFIINLIRALREAAQELGGFKTPDPRKDVIYYAEFIHARNLDSLKEVLRIGKELTNSSFFTNFLDTLRKLGLNDMYKAFLNEASQEEFFEEYAKAYNNFYRGSF